MKKLSVVLLALLLVCASSASVFATSDFTASVTAVYATSNGLGTYNPNSEIILTVTLNNVVAPTANDGASIFYLQVYYDKAMVAPVFKGDAESDGSQTDFTPLIKTSPDKWEGFGKLDEEEGMYDIGFWNPNLRYPVTSQNELIIEIPFAVNADTRVDDIVFSFKDVKIYNRDMSLSYDAEIDDITVEYALQPEELVTLPEDAVGIDVAGYQNGVSFVHYCPDETTLGDALEGFGAGGTDLDSYAIAIVFSENVITDLSIPDSDNTLESDAVIPKGSYIIGVHNSSDAYSRFCESALDKKGVELYNLNIESAGKDNIATPLTDVGFKLYDTKPVLMQGVSALYNGDFSLLRVYENSLTVGEFKAWFENEITVNNNATPVSDDELLATGMTVGFLEKATVIVMGDVNSDGVVNTSDYVLVARHYMQTYTLKGNELTAACIVGKTEPQISDYVLIARVYFGTFELKQLI